MKIVEPEVAIEAAMPWTAAVKVISKAARTCYKSEKNEFNYEKEIMFIQNLIRNGHESTIEHVNVTFKVICDRGVTHELVRHRLASYSQESTRYVKYDGDMEFINPCFWNKDFIEYDQWKKACLTAEENYKCLLDMGAKPEEARSILPNSLKTEVVVTMNLRELRHFFKLRCSQAAHPQMREIAILMLLTISSRGYSVFFEDLDVYKHVKQEVDQAGGY